MSILRRLLNVSRILLEAHLMVARTEAQRDFTRLILGLVLIAIASTCLATAWLLLHVVALLLLRDAGYNWGPSLLGPPRHFQELAERADAPGVAIGLAWTASGGDILFIEATSFPSAQPGLKLTGQLGDVMKESAEAALSVLRSRVALLGIDPEIFGKTAFHLHVPAGGIPKDGPSAGITMVTALASLLTGRRVRPQLAMTGEITLRGKVLPVGGVKEKVLAARRAGVKEILLPRHNENDLEDVPPQLRAELVYHFVDTIEEVLALGLEPPASDSPAS